MRENNSVMNEISGAINNVVHVEDFENPLKLGEEPHITISSEFSNVTVIMS